ncbi:MAG: peptide deformylase [Candidatus Omnitrophica bacterium]|nr:peptide deformylase [Candidatus Omnitrophota bacterium]MDD5352037.1 peptide deformylase [Candidatus Omnitrophota bacterium]MDD5551179.1 peptide deformylase [Candidatus Omnitrophota bacterium]
MEPLEIKKYPDSVLRKKCIVVERITETEVQLFEEMLFTMRHFAGIGLAAPQIGITRNMVVADIGEGPIMLANPKILNLRGAEKMEEGCLSIPGVEVVVERADEIMISGLNEKDEAIKLKARGLLARVLQHEIDHLQGKLIIDYVGLLEKMMLFKFKFKKPNDKYANL